MRSVDLVLLVAAGVASGVVNAAAGGGSLLLFPALLAVGFPPLPANVTNLLTLAAHDDLRRLNAVKGVLSLIISVVSVAVFAIGAPVGLAGCCAACPTTLVEGFLGAKLAGRVPAPVLRVTVVVVSLAVYIRDRRTAHHVRTRRATGDGKCR